MSRVMLRAPVMSTVYTWMLSRMTVAACCGLLMVSAGMLMRLDWEDDK